jgi:hypothetical protein
VSDVSLTGMNIQLRLQTPYDLVLTAGVDKNFDKAGIFGVMDMLTEVAEREQLRGELMSLKIVLRRNKELLATGKFDRDIDKIRSQRAEYDKDISASWVASSKRGRAEMNGQQKTKMAEFGKQIEETEKTKRDIENGIPLTEWQIDCLFARINGQAEPPMPERVLALMPQIELPEDVSFMQSAA